MEIPRMVKPRGLYFCWNSIIHGISTLQGSHQVAQKFTRTTSPLYCWRVTSLSLRSFRTTVGASVGVAGALADGAPAAGNLWSAQTMTASKAITPAAINTPFFIFALLSCGLQVQPARVTAQTCSESPVYPIAKSGGSKKSALPRTTEARRSRLPPYAGGGGIAGKNAKTG